MKKIILVVLLFLLPSIGLADIRGFSGNDWQDWDDTEKIYFVSGFLAGSGFIIEGVLLHSSAIIDNYHAQDDLKQALQINHAYFNRLSIPLITVGQIVDGLNLLYKDYKNRMIPITDMVYVIKKQSTGTPEDKIEKILLYLRNGKKDPKLLADFGPNGEVIGGVSFP